MKITDYPAQEPLSAAGAAYGDECWARGEGINGDEIAYGTDPYQRLIVHRAPAPDGRVLLFWHGGGWTSGYKEWMSFMAPAFTAAGVTFVTAGYRLAPAQVFPVGLEDCAAALRLVHARCADWGCDPARLFIGGHSAGGHYAGLLGTSADWRRRLGIADSLIAGVLPLSGVYWFGEGSGLSIRPRFLGADPDNDAAASPLAFIDAPSRVVVDDGASPVAVADAAAAAAASRLQWRGRGRLFSSPGVAGTSRTSSGREKRS